MKAVTLNDKRTPIAHFPEFCISFTYRSSNGAGTRLGPSSSTVSDGSASTSDGAKDSGGGSSTARRKSPKRVKSLRSRRRWGFEFHTGSRQQAGGGGGSGPQRFAAR